ncbi:CopM family metallochaperone [Antarcticirhabdus aurantiaca]|uniref:DUF305 domain-containing protein n=1 Tax=Antarcticirhabdus aurantiaca TaxID=2606717 RepID=A0ACD4NXS5_9HYPH|nr:DUF305 domain-containing protein [Antarcticirhabdus aurantiaca]WAJ31249.1 DUF305 domain-containing protein [Jeongeuplla avenae]
MRKTLILSAALTTLAFGAATAQESGSSMQNHSGGSSMSQEQVQLPEACTKAAGSMDMSSMSGAMGGMMSGEGKSEVVKANMDAMMKMHMPMMQAMMIEDPDLAFNCGMIAHHQGAIAMAEVELKMGKDEESKKMAQKIIDDQKKEIEEMTAWVSEHAG